MAGELGLKPNPPVATEHLRFVGVKVTLRRVLARSVLACGCAPHAASAPALTPPPLFPVILLCPIMDKLWRLLHTMLRVDVFSAPSTSTPKCLA